MNALWNELLGTMLRPARPRLSQCRARANAHAIEERRDAELRTQALAHCRSRIEDARASVFAAGDGVVKADMTALEGEWLALARAERSCEERTLALWNAIAPRHWAGQLRWPSTGDMAADVEAAVALASDPEGVERAEACALRLASVLSAWGFDVAPTVTWLVARAPQITRAEALLERPLRALTDAIATTYGAEALVARAHRVERDVLDAATQSPLLSTNETNETNEGLAADLALVARVDFLWRACAVESRRVPAHATPTPTPSAGSTSSIAPPPRCSSCGGPVTCCPRSTVRA